MVTTFNLFYTYRYALGTNQRTRANAAYARTRRTRERGVRAKAANARTQRTSAPKEADLLEMFKSM